jgi:WXG100 family type VII secretion target
MGDQFRAGAGAIEKSAGIVDQTRTDLKAQISTLKGQMEQVAQYWEGQGAASFAKVRDAWSTQAQDVIDVLDIFEQNLKANQKRYVSDDEAAAQKLSKYTSQLGG